MLNTFPFELVEESGKHFIYQFTSDKRGDYVVRFSKATYYFNQICTSCERIYEVAFFPKDKHQGFDVKIQNTLLGIMEHFMKKYNSPLLYVCESLDGLEQCRLTLFEKWCRSAKMAGKLFHHESRSIKWLDSEILIGIIAFPWDTNFELYFNEIGVE